MKPDKTKPEEPPARVTIARLAIARARYGGYFVFSPPEASRSTPASWPNA